MNSSQLFWKKNAKKYLNQPISDNEAYEHKLSKTKQYYNQDTKVLEIGCGSGDTAFKHANNVQNYLGIDYCESFINHANETLKNSDVNNLVFNQASLEDIDIQSLDIDLVLALSVFHLLPNPQKVIQDIYSALPKNGTLISSTSCIKDMPFLLRLILPLMQKLGFAPLIATFTQSELVTMMQDAGFKIDYQWQPKKGSAVFLIAKK